MKRTILIGMGLALAGVGYFQARGQEPATAPSTPPQGPAAQYSATMGKYCFTCHNEKLKTADLILSKEDVANPAANPEVWEKVVRKLRARGMPPVGMPRPDNATYDAFAGYLESALDQAATAKPNPGRPTAAHRLNRTEYINSVRDLLSLDVDGDQLLPADDSGGFDNLGDLLSVSPGLMEKYVSAAAKIARLAVGDPEIHADVATYTVSPLMV